MITAPALSEIACVDKRQHVQDRSQYVSLDGNVMQA